MKKHVPTKHRSKLLKTYQRYLREVAGLAPSTCQNHLRDLGHFLKARSIQSAAAFSRLSQVDVTSYLTCAERGLCARLAAQCRQLRARFLAVCAAARLDAPTAGVGGSQDRLWRHNDLPFYLSGPQLESLLASWDRTNR